MSLRNPLPFLALLVGVLSAGCTLASTPDITATPSLLPPTPLVLTLTATGTIVPTQATQTPEPTGTVTSSPTPDYSPTPLPRWRLYEMALAKAMFTFDVYPSHNTANVFCEWEVYGHTQYRVYLYAVCQDAASADGSAGSMPAVLYLAADGTIEKAVIPEDGAGYRPSVERMFPADILPYVNSSSSLFAYDSNAAIAHIDYRREHPGTPPQIVADGVELP